MRLTDYLFFRLEQVSVVSQGIQASFESPAEEKQTSPELVWRILVMIIWIS